jgi:hypothetical protein
LSEWIAVIYDICVFKFDLHILFFIGI